MNEKALGFSYVGSCSISSQSLFDKRNKLLEEVDFKRYWFTTDLVITFWTQVLWSVRNKRSKVLK